MKQWIGIDLGASAIHAVALAAAPTGRSRVVEAHIFDGTDLAGVVEFVADAERIAIDAPAELSTARHGADESLKPKFRTARCAEIALGELERIWVPWTTPTVPVMASGWMRVGFSLWSVLRAAGHEPLEVYPAGVFRVLAGKRPPKKTTAAGLRARIDLLAPHVELPTGIDVWSHDGIDALAAALTARWSTDGRARSVRHVDPGCDDSAIWIPHHVTTTVT